MLFICILLQLNNYQRIEAILENSSTRFEKLVLTKDQFQNSLVDDKEIFLNGKMYDIKETRFNKDTVELIAYHDVKEDGLISIIENFFDRENSGNDFAVKVLKLLVTVYTFSSLQLEFTQPYISGKFFMIHPGNYISFTGETLSPPPDSVS